MTTQIHDHEGTILAVRETDTGYLVDLDIVEDLSPEETHARFMEDLESNGGGVPILVRHRTHREQLSREEGHQILGSISLRNS